MNVPQELLYTKEHEWCSVNGNIVTVGITDHAQEQLGDVVYVELPKEGDAVRQGEAFGVIESVKAVSDLFAPVSGRVREVNRPITENPGIVNDDVYEEGWMIKIEMSNPDEIKDLLTAERYGVLLDGGD